MSAAARMDSSSSLTLVGQAGRAARRTAPTRAAIFLWIPLLRAMARIRIADDAMADELVEATLRAAIEGIEACDFEIGIKSWLLGIQRTIHRNRQVDAAGEAELPLEDSPRSILLRLPDELREPLFLADGAGLDLAEIAGILDRDVTSAQSRIEAARRLVLQLREALDASSRPDFQVSKASVRAWKLQAVSSRARELVRHAALPGTSGCRSGECFADHRGVNDFAYYVRARGYTVDLLGPQGPLRI